MKAVNSLEGILAYQCAPALAGIKPANIAACTKAKIPSAADEIERLNRQLNSSGIYIDILCKCEKRVLFMVYRREKLAAYLSRPEIKAFLADCGYPKNFSVGEYIEFLRLRLRGKAFPHEIGAFLGYPLHDIYGFINHKDEGCLLTGEWKVYAEADKAKTLFGRYRACRRAILRRISEGKTLAQLFAA